MEVSRGTSNVPGNWSRTLFIPENSQEICLLCTSARSGEREYYFLPFSPQVFFYCFSISLLFKEHQKMKCASFMCIEKMSFISLMDGLRLSFRFLNFSFELKALLKIFFGGPPYQLMSKLE